MDQVQSTMLPLCYGAPQEKENAIASRIGAISGRTPVQARELMMVGSKQECIDKVAAYAEIGVTHFILNAQWPILNDDEFQAFAEDVAPAARSA